MLFFYLEDVIFQWLFLSVNPSGLFMVVSLGFQLHKLESPFKATHTDSIIPVRFGVKCQKYLYPFCRILHATFLELYSNGAGSTFHLRGKDFYGKQLTICWYNCSLLLIRPRSSPLEGACLRCWRHPIWIKIPCMLTAQMLKYSFVLVHTFVLNTQSNISAVEWI